MKAFAITHAGAEPQLIDIPRPIPGAGEVLIRVSACGLNFADILMAKGTYQDTPNPPFSLGLEVSGIVVETGPDVAAPAAGTRVAAFIGSGGLAEYAVVPVERCIEVPDSMTDVIAAGFQIAYGTSHLALTRRAGLQAGETLVVLGAAGGVGLTAVEIGAALGARVIAIARGEAKLEIARAAGAQHTIEASADIREELKALGPSNVVYDAVGGEVGSAALRALAPEGRYLAIGFASGDVPEVKLNHLLVKNIDVMGFYWGGYLKFNGAALRDSLDALMKMHAAGQLAPHVSHTLPLSQAGEALALLRDRKSTGKVVVTCAD